MPLPPNAGEGVSEAIGAGNYEVQQGDCVFSIADRAGLFWETVWNHPRNQALKQKRGSPHVLLPGDQVFVPPLEVKTEPRGTDARHKFVRKGIPIEFELKVMHGDEPRRGVPYILTVEGERTTGSVPEDGIIRIPIRPSDRSGTLILRPGESQEEYTLDFGHLDPAHALSGAKGRLRNLGLLGEDDSEEALADALGIFQKKHSLPVTGELDDATARKLTEVHGS